MTLERSLHSQEVAWEELGRHPGRGGKEVQLTKNVHQVSHLQLGNDRWPGLYSEECLQRYSPNPIHSLQKILSLAAQNVQLCLCGNYCVVISLKESIKLKSKSLFPELEVYLQTA